MRTTVRTLDRFEKVGTHGGLLACEQLMAGRHPSGTIEMMIYPQGGGDSQTFSLHADSQRMLREYLAQSLSTYPNVPATGPRRISVRCLALLLTVAEKLKVRYGDPREPIWMVRRMESADISIRATSRR